MSRTFSQTAWILKYCAPGLALIAALIFPPSLYGSRSILAGSPAAPEFAPRANIIVDTGEDELNSDGDCSLREAVQSANTDSAIDDCQPGNGNDLIALPAGVYTLSIGGNGEDNNLEGDLDITGVLTITGVSAANSIIQAGTDATNGVDRLLHALDNSRLVVRSLTLRYGLTLYGSSPHINGGAIFVGRNASLDVYRCLITQNQGANGGGITNNFGSVQIDQSTFSNNLGGSGGGGVRSMGLVTIDHSTFTQNTAAFGGALSVDSGAGIITNTTFSNNTAFDGLMASGYGGAIHNNDTITITNSTISGNTALQLDGGFSEGGGIRNMNRLLLRNSTLTGNSALAGAGIFASAERTTIHNSLVANNLLPGSDCSGVIVSAGHNIDSDLSCNFTQPDDMPGNDPLLGVLGDNGGPTLTHALLTGSPAIDHGDCSSGLVTLDQRGVPRPQGDTCDIGAYEYNGEPFVVAMDDAFGTSEDMPLLVPAPGALFNDLSYFILTATLSAAPQHGLVSLSSDGGFVYTPTLNYNGMDFFTYIAANGPLTDTATVTVGIDPVNDAPLARNDAFTTPEDTPLNVPAGGLLDNDTDVEGDTLLVTSTSGNVSGSLIVNPNGSFTFTPGLNFSGQELFTYTISDGAASESATAVIIVTAVNDAPLAAQETYTITNDAILTVPAPGVLGNDLDVDGDILTAELVSDPISGTLSLNPDGSFVYAPDFQFMGESVSFEYQVYDGQVSTGPVSVSIHILRKEFFIHLPILSR